MAKTASKKREPTMLIKASAVQVGMMLATPRKKVTKTKKCGTVVMLELGGDTTVTAKASKKIRILSC